MDENKGGQKKYDFIFDDVEKGGAPEMVESDMDENVVPEVSEGREEKTEKPEEREVTEASEKAEGKREGFSLDENVVPEKSEGVKLEEIEIPERKMIFGQPPVVPEVHEVKSEGANEGRKQSKSGAGSWVYLLVAGLLGMTIGACVMIALVYGGVLGKTKIETQVQYIEKDCECDCEEEKKEEEKCSCEESGNETSGNKTSENKTSGGKNKTNSTNSTNATNTTGKE